MEDPASPPEQPAGGQKGAQPTQVSMTPSQELPTEEHHEFFGEAHMAHAIEGHLDTAQELVDEELATTDGPSCSQRCTRCFFRKDTLFKILGLVLYIGVVLVLVRVVKVQDKIGDIQRLAEQQLPLCGFLIVVLYFTTVVFFLPGTTLTIITAGLIFNFWAAVALIWIGSILAQSAGFLLGRHVLQSFVLRMASRYQVWKVLSAAVTEQGFLVALLLRAPGMPYNLLNWLFGITEIPFWIYSLASAIGVLPKVVLYVYFGNVFAELIQLFTGDEPATTEDIVRVSLGLGLAILALILIVVVVRRAYIKKLREVQAAEAEAAAAAALENGDRAATEAEGDGASAGGVAKEGVIVADTKGMADWEEGSQSQHSSRIPGEARTASSPDAVASGENSTASNDTSSVCSLTANGMTP